MSDPRIYSRSSNVPAPERNLALELNPEQAAAATFGEGPLLIIAGAGTGKTRTLVYRVAHLIDAGVPPERILLLTFTRRAAQEMLSRAERLVGSASRNVAGGTFHGTGHRLLRKFGTAAGVPSDFTIMDQGDAEDLMQLSRAQLGLGDTKKRFPKKETLHYIYSRHVNTAIAVDDILKDEYPHFVDYKENIARVFADYTERKSTRNLVDYDDLLLFWEAMLDASSTLADRITRLYDYLLVDEYQDTNTLQARVLAGMCRSHRNIAVVGDDAQSIYSFRGASFRNILDFPREFQGTTIVTLEQNYRSTQPILDATNTLISRADERFTKNLWTKREGGEPPWLVSVQDEAQQTRFVVERILELHEEGTPLREMAVLFSRRIHVGRSRDRIDQPKDSVREVGRAQVPRSRPCEGCAGLFAHFGESARRGELVPHSHAPAGHRRHHGALGHRCHDRQCLGPTSIPALGTTPEGPQRARLVRRAVGPVAAGGRRHAPGR